MLLGACRRAAPAPQAVARLLSRAATAWIPAAVAALLQLLAAALVCGAASAEDHLDTP